MIQKPAAKQSIKLSFTILYINLIKYLIFLAGGILKLKSNENSKSFEM